MFKLKRFPKRKGDTIAWLLGFRSNQHSISAFERKMRKETKKHEQVPGYYEWKERGKSYIFARFLVFDTNISGNLACCVLDSISKDEVLKLVPEMVVKSSTKLWRVIKKKFPEINEEEFQQALTGEPL